MVARINGYAKKLSKSVHRIGLCQLSGHMRTEHNQPWRNFFSSDYAQARQYFREAAKALDARLESLTLKARGPNNLLLTIDIAWLGATLPRRVIVHQSGVHGVEGFAGSAIQLRIMSNPPKLRNDTALIFVHAFNPYGMSWLRRTNEYNVDLNRNCLLEGENWSGATEGYRKFNTLINPTSPPTFDFFKFKALLSILRFGFSALKQAIALGQYDYPNGLFYGGAKLEQGPALYKAWLNDRLKFVSRILVIDVHTGLGKWGQENLFLEPPFCAQKRQQLTQLWNKPIKLADRENSPGYKIRGSLSNLFVDQFNQGSAVYLVQELGTYSALEVIHALREENRCHFFSETHVNHPAKLKLKKVMCPPSNSWRRQILDNGVELLQKGLVFLDANLNFETNNRDSRI